ncbi:MAG: decaprenylphospho-beta-D-erythro-pentofuranosid-2-ulose 2-reductase [Acidimicrobiales bacterium]
MNDAFAQPQSVLVLGGTSDIARAIVRSLVAARTRTVVLAGRDTARLAVAAQDARAAGADSVSTTGFDADDVGRHSEVLNKVFADSTGFDLVIMAVGVLGDQSHDEADPVAAAGVIWTNFAGPAAACLVVAERLRAQGHGTLVVLSSVAGERVRRANFVYGSSKAGLDGFAQGLGDALVGSGARVMVVRPGFVHTKMTAGMKVVPMAATADQVARAVVDGLAKGAEVVWVPPALRLMMAVARHLPRAVFRRLPV